MSAAINDLRGQKFGDLVVTEESGRASNGGVVWKCRCVCGNSARVAASDLRRWQPGHILSCGCRHREAGRKNRTHGDSRKPEFSVWMNMLDRCSNPKAKAYPHYGGRGISVCRRWQHYENFLADVGRRPSAQHSIERRNNNGNYTPANCVWATRKEQACNRKTARLISFRGRKQCLTAWAEELGITKQSLCRRLERWPLRRALTEGAPHGLRS